MSWRIAGTPFLLISSQVNSHYVRMALVLFISALIFHRPSPPCLSEKSQFVTTPDEMRLRRRLQLLENARLRQVETPALSQTATAALFPLHYLISSVLPFFLAKTHRSALGHGFMNINCHFRLRLSSYSGFIPQVHKYLLIKTHQRLLSVNGAISNGTISRIFSLARFWYRSIYWDRKWLILLKLFLTPNILFVNLTEKRK